VTSAALTLQEAMRERLLSHAPLIALLQGAHVFDEAPRGAHAPYVAFAAIETRDWSVMEAKAHEHFVSIEVATRERSRAQAQDIMGEIDAALDRAPLVLSGHALINLSAVFATVSRIRGSEHFGGLIRFRAVTEAV
jgi:hypothetical protein